MEETIRRYLEVKERNDTQHRSQNVSVEGRQGLYDCENMAYRNPTKPSSHPFDDKHLLDAHPKDGIYTSSRLLGARMKEAASDTLVHRHTPVGVTREPVGGLHRHSSTEDNAMSFSKPDTILNVVYLNKPSVDPAANRTTTVAVVTNTEATQSQHRSLPNVDQTDSTSDDVPQRPTTKEESAMLHEVHSKRSTTPIPLVARMTRNDFSGSADDRKKLNLRSIKHGCTQGAEPRTDKVTCSTTTTQETSFQDP